MMQWIIMAFRNILRNKRRSLVTLIAIGVGFAAISLYYGYLHHVYWGLKVTAIRGEGLGHLRINKAGWQEKGKLEPEKYMFTQEETQKIIKLVKEEKGVVLCTPQIQVTGMVLHQKQHPGQLGGLFAQAFEPYFSANDRFDAALAPFFVKFDRTKQVA